MMSLKYKIVASLIILANLLLTVHSIRWNFATIDEVRQIPAGLSHWRMGSFKLAKDSPPLGRLLGVMPILAADHSEWFLGYIDRPIYLNFTISDQISASFASENAKRLMDLVRLARLAGFGWWLLGGWLVFRWCRALYGDRASYLGLVLWSFEPNVLAYEPLATSQLPAAVTALAASYAFWRYVRDASSERALVAGLLLGVAEVTDFSALLLYALWPILAVVYWLTQGRDDGRVRSIAHRVGQAVFILLLSIWVINLGYAASDTGRPLRDFDFISRSLGGDSRSENPFHGNIPIGNRFRGSWLGRLPVPVPAEYLLGIDLHCRTVEAEGFSPTSGEKSTSADIGNFGAAVFVTKIPLGLLIMVLWSAVLTLFRCRERASRGDGLFWALPLLTFGGLAVARSGSHLFSSRAHLLVPYGIIAASRLAVYLQPAHPKSGGLVIAILAWTISSGLSVFPNTFCYRNELVGRPSHLAATPVPRQEDDGGQQLLRLQYWRHTHPNARGLRVALQHLVDPREYGFSSSPPPFDARSTHLDINDPPPQIGPRPGYYAIDRSMLASSDFRYFNEFTPIDKLGCSLLIYHITSEGTERVRRRLGIAAIEDANKKYRRAVRQEILSESAFQLQVYEDPNGRKSNYAVFVPSSYRSDTPHRLILFLHGAGDAGTAGRQYLNVGLPWIIEQTRNSFGFIVVCPQGRTGGWDPGSEDGERAIGILAEVEKKLNVDQKRIVLTGLSSGGRGTWALAARYPDRWAAIVPVASTCDEKQAKLIRHIPCWCFHNCNDESWYYHQYDAPGSPVDIPRRMIRALVAAGGKPRYTEFLTIGDTHNAWDKAYTMSELFDWMAKQRRP
jgi:pimeloyl-ACP methyl ester carboxylesterase